MNNSLIAPMYEDLEITGGQAYTRSAGVAYIVFVVSVFVIAALWLTGRDQLLRMAIPAMALLNGVALYFSRPVIYIQYSLWVWFLSPLARRIVDWHFGYTEPNLVLVAALLVSAVGGLTLILPGRRANTQIPAAFVLCGSAILYGFLVGMVLHPSGETVYGLFNWLCPMLFGLHLVLNWQQNEEHRAATSRTFLWGVLVLGLYGVYQYFSPPAWDRYWLENVMSQGQNESFGRPEAFQVRVWSTLNSPGPFANTMMAGLLILLTLRSRLKMPAAIAGYLSFLLAAVRTAWLSWLVGLFLILKSAKSRVLVRICLSIILVVVCVLPLVSNSRINTVISDRAHTFTDLGHDDSFRARVDMYRILFADVIDNPFGQGLKNLEVSRGIAVDSGILIVLFSLGWLGTLLFGAGVLSLFAGEERSLKDTHPFAIVTKAIIIAILMQVIGGNIFVNVTGAIFWTFVGLYISARKHHSHEMVAAGPDIYA